MENPLNQLRLGLCLKSKYFWVVLGILTVVVLFKQEPDLPSRLAEVSAREEIKKEYLEAPFLVDSKTGTFWVKNRWQSDKRANEREICRCY